MIITKEFIWFHLGKTGGDMFHTLMNKHCKDKIMFQHGIKDPEKHLNYNNIPKQYKHIDKYIIGFRRLPSWLVSHNRHMFRTTCRKMSYNEMKSISEEGHLIENDVLSEHTPDSVLYSYIGDLSNIIFIRQEYLVSDFFNVISKYHKCIQDEKDDQLVANKNYAVENFTLSDNAMDNLYHKNPLWRELENKLYK